MRRMELDQFFAEIFRIGLERKAVTQFDLYQSRNINAKLYELGEQGVTIEVFWKRFNQTEFISLDRRQADELDTFVWALADFEWVVLNNDERWQLQQRLDFFAEKAAV